MLILPNGKIIIYNNKLYFYHTNKYTTLPYSSYNYISVYKDMTSYSFDITTKCTYIIANISSPNVHINNTYWGIIDTTLCIPVSNRTYMKNIIIYPRDTSSFQNFKGSLSYNCNTTSYMCNIGISGFSSNIIKLTSIEIQYLCIWFT